MPDLVYESIPELSESEISAAIETNNSNELSTVALSAALHLANHKLAEEICIKLAEHSNPVVRGNALLGFGHIARIDGKLDEIKVKHLIRKGLADRDEFVAGQAESAKDDIESFLGWIFEE